MLLYCLLEVAPATAQCVMCRTQTKSNTDTKEGRHVAEGINKGIIYLVAIPYLIVFVVAYFWYRSAKRSAKQSSRHRSTSSSVPGSAYLRE